MSAPEEARRSRLATTALVVGAVLLPMIAHLEGLRDAAWALWLGSFVLAVAAATVSVRAVVRARHRSDGREHRIGS